MRKSWASDHASSHLQFSWESLSLLERRWIPETWSLGKAASCDHGINDLFWVGNCIPASSKHWVEKHWFFPHPHRVWAPGAEQNRSQARSSYGLMPRNKKLWHPNQVEQLEQEMGDLVSGPDACRLVGKQVVWNWEPEIPSQTVPTTAIWNDTWFTHLSALPGSWKALGTQNKAFKLCLYRPLDTAIWPEAVPQDQGHAVYHYLPYRKISTASRMRHSLLPLPLSRGEQPHRLGLAMW